MHRSIRIGLFVLVLVGVVAGSALAAAGLRGNKPSSLLASSAAPEASESEATPPTADELARAVARLGDHGVTATVGQLEALAGKYGLGGAIRLLAWSDRTGKSVADLSAMRDAGKGWGQLARELGVSPGIGWIMGNGHGGGPQQKDHGVDADASTDESPGD